MSTNIHAVSSALSTKPLDTPIFHASNQGWSPNNTSTRIAQSDEERRGVYRLRYDVYVHEQGRQLHGIDVLKGELHDPLDRLSCLWYARNEQQNVGTITQTLIGPDSDLALLPTELQLESFPCSRNCRLGFSSRFAIAPNFRGMWVLPSLARYSYAYGRLNAGKFDFMVTNPALVPLFERLGYLRYTETATYAHDKVGLLIPMVLPATDYQHMTEVRSVCLPATTHFPSEPEWGAWLRAKFPAIGMYYGSDQRLAMQSVSLSKQSQLPVEIAIELGSQGFVHHFPADTILRRVGDRVTYTFILLEGRIVAHTPDENRNSLLEVASDGTTFSPRSIHCETDAVVLCVSDSAVQRLQRRYPEYSARLQCLLSTDSPTIEGQPIYR